MQSRAPASSDRACGPWGGGGFGLIYVFGLFILFERAAAKGDDFAAGVGDFEGDAIAERIDGAAAFFAVARNAGGDHFLQCEAIGLELVDGPGVAARRVADAEALAEFAIEAAALQIIARVLAFASRERFAIEARGARGELDQTLAAGVFAAI